ncbi:MAG: iron dependent repressor, metal binding and dimerization domain protein, partial [Chitinophagales bacterium]
IAPAAAARYWTNNLFKLLLIAIVFGFFATYFGAFVSYTHAGMPTGPWVVVFLSVFAFLSILFAPRKGILHRHLQQQETQKRIVAENVLKSFIYIGQQKDTAVMARRTWSELVDNCKMNAVQLKKTLARLSRKKGLIYQNDTWQLTEEGAQRGFQLIKLHRLWELYLTEYMNIASDHVHNDAEAIEHIITPEIERQLEEKLGHPVLDPHGSPIDLRKKVLD